MTREDRLAELLERWEASTGSNGSTTLSEFCSDCPDLVDDFRILLQQLGKLDCILGDKSTADGPTHDATLVEGIAAGRYRPLSFHARGGLGIVFVAEDQELHRKVALKCMQRIAATDTPSRHRFLLEAEITGKLEHPGIVPVYGLGIDPDGKPYYAMRFIEGETFEEAIARHHAADREDASKINVERRRLLRQFGSVCETIAYAHSRGVLHRDLKPANIMIGPYGETLVVDWGLAKRLTGSEAEPAESTGTDDASLTDDFASTMPGQVKGTPAFMSPEQARGEWDQVDTGCDIYSLGATLFVLLTGRRPFEGRSAREIVEQVQRGGHPEPRSIRPDTPRALEAICLKAMQFGPEDRYATAKALATDVEQWLADEPVSAWREPFIDRARRWGRKHRSFVTGFGALLVTTIVGLALGLYLVNQERRKTGEALTRATEAESQTAGALKQVTEEQQHTAAALAQVRVEKTNTETALNRVTEEQEKTRKAYEAEQTALKVSQKAESAATQQRQLSLGTMQRVVNKIDQRLKGRADTQDLRKELLGEARDGLREVARAADTAAVIDRATMRVHFEMSSIFLTIDGSVEDAKKECDRAITIIDAMAKTTPNDPNVRFDRMDGLSRRSEVLLHMGKVEDAFKDAAEAATIGEALAEKFPNSAQLQRDLSVMYVHVGTALTRMGHLKDALWVLQKARKIRLERTVKEPGNPQTWIDLMETHSDIGNLHRASGDFKAALAEYLQVQAVDRILLLMQKNDSRAGFRLVSACEVVGYTRLDLSDYEAARKDLEEGLQLTRKLRANDPRNLPLARLEARFLVHFAFADEKQNKIDDGMARLREAIAIAAQTAAVDRADAEAQNDHASYIERLGFLHLVREENEQARELFLQALVIFERLAMLSAKDTRMQLGVVLADFKLGEATERSTGGDAAIRIYEKALRRLDELTEEKLITNLKQAEQIRASLKVRIAICQDGEAVLKDPSVIKNFTGRKGPLLVYASRLAVKRKDFALASRFAEMMAELEGPPVNLVGAATTYAWCHTATNDADMKEKYGKRAVELLRKAVALGLKEKRDLKDDVKLMGLRERKDFQQLIDEIAKDAPSPKK